MAMSLVQNRQVYLIAREVFTGQKAALRRKQQVRKVVVASQDVFQPVIDSLGEDNVVSIIVKLLRLGVFDSNSAADNKFSGLFTPVLSPVAEAAPEVIVATVATGASTTDRIQVQNGVILGDSNTVDEAGVEESLQTGEIEVVSNGVEICPEVAQNADITQVIEVTNSPLRSAFVPIYAQHLLLTEVQRILEECCYNFAQRWLPKVLLERQCDCAIALELNDWSYLIQRNILLVPEEAVNADINTATSVLQKVVKLRHSAVHRLKMSVGDLQGLVHTSAALTSLLKDSRPTSALEHIASGLERTISSLERTDKDAESTAKEKLQVVERKQKALEEEKKQIIANMLEIKAKGRSKIGAFIQRSVNELPQITPRTSNNSSDEFQEDDEFYDSFEDVFEVVAT